MDMKTALTERLQAALESFLESEKLTETPKVRVLVEEPRNRDHGDFATNLAMQLTRALRRNPMQIAEQLLEHLDREGLIREATIAKPGFINFRMETAATSNILRRIAEEGRQYGRTKSGGGVKVLVEFVSANPTGPLHIGHARNAVVGDVLGRVLDAAGYDVTREYYFNDAGNQMRMLGTSLKLRVDEKLGREVDWPEQYYRGDYVQDIAAKMIEEQGAEEAGREKPLQDFTQYAVREILKTIDADLKEMRIDFDNWFSETTLHKNGAVEATLEELKKRDRIYEHEGAQWIRTTDYGDEKDRVVVKSDGDYTYVMPDIAYHREKYSRGYERLINVLGGDHHGYVPRLRAAVAALGHEKDALQCVIIQMVSLLKDGETMKLSTRSGEFLTLREAVEELGQNVVRYFFAMRSPDSQMVFDWGLAKDTSMDNPVYYVQYAHARCCSLFRKAEELGLDFQGVEKADLSLLTEQDELAVMRALARMPEVTDNAAAELAPHLITNYLEELAQLFHNLFTKGNQDVRLRFVQPEEPALSQARLALIGALRQCLANALEMLGIEPMERM